MFKRFIDSSVDQSDVNTEPTPQRYLPAGSTIAGSTSSIVLQVTCVTLLHFEQYLWTPPHVQSLHLVQTFTLLCCDFLGSMIAIGNVASFGCWSLLRQTHTVHHLLLSSFPSNPIEYSHSRLAFVVAVRLT